LLDAARLDAGTFALHLDPTDLATKCKQALESMRRQAEQVGVQLALSVPTQPIMLRVDPQRIDQVLVNLLTNALKFTRPGGHVALNVLPLADAVRFEVRDDGIGIDDADLARLFKRFSQLEGGVRRGGTGLGLSISKAIVEAHGGCIGVESAPGRGSTFWFTLPRADSEG
ncbi:MAG: two-component sensor histidine kinase, partial [Cyanobacteria bacterium RYN_339]|nr:two-component sensor histidine kinase [Cyanobacteria bacterium RYN_339]